jgi:hypothetical protein
MFFRYILPVCTLLHARVCHAMAWFFLYTIT